MSEKWKSYPNPARTVEEAEKLAAAAALEDLKKDTKSLALTSNENLVVDRILKIVHSHPNGIFESKVIEYYSDTYQERLPENWRTLIGSLITEDTGANEASILCPRSDKVCRVILILVLKKLIFFN